MAKEKENVQSTQAPAEESPAVAETPQPTARERYMSRYQQAHPDMNMDDEEAFYGQANANLDELEGFRESNRQLGETFDKAPLLAGLLIAAKDGENPFVYLAENVGPDMDIRELANDPEFGKKMGEALTKYQDNLVKSEEARKQFGDNLQKSIEALKEVQQERGMSDEERQALFEKMYGKVGEDDEVLDNGIIGNASIGIVPKEVWDAVLKAQNYDSDIASASEKARATALNEKLQNPKRDLGTGLPQSLSTGGSGKPKEKKKTSSFADFGM